MSDKVKIGIIGVGTIGTVHANNYAKVANAEIVALCDILPDRLAEKAKTFNIAKTYADYNALLADPEIDAVSVCVPNDMHAPIAIAALNAGKHVMLEKPMTLSAELGKQILAAMSPRAYKIALCVEGKQLSSEQLAKRIEEIGQTHGEVCRVIGSSFGLSPAVKSACDLRLSVSALTFPHQLMRVILLEATYRAFTIIKGTPYHK